MVSSSSYLSPPPDPSPPSSPPGPGMAYLSRHGLSYPSPFPSSVCFLLVRGMPSPTHGDLNATSLFLLGAGALRSSGEVVFPGCEGYP